MIEYLGMILLLAIIVPWTTYITVKLAVLAYYLAKHQAKEYTQEDKKYGK